MRPARIGTRDPPLSGGSRRKYFSISFWRWREFPIWPPCSSSLPRTRHRGQMGLWAEGNGICLRIPASLDAGIFRPVVVFFPYISFMLANSYFFDNLTGCCVVIIVVPVVSIHSPQIIGRAAPGVYGPLGSPPQPCERWMHLVYNTSKLVSKSTIPSEQCFYK